MHTVLLHKMRDEMIQIVVGPERTVKLEVKRLALSPSL